MVCSEETSTGKIIAKSANQIILPKFHGGTKCCNNYVGQTPLSSLVGKIHFFHPEYGYFANSMEQDLAYSETRSPIQAIEIFQGSGVNITVEGRRHLGVVLESRLFIDTYVEEKLSHGDKSPGYHCHHPSPVGLCCLHTRTHQQNYPFQETAVEYCLCLEWREVDNFWIPVTARFSLYFYLISLNA